MVVFINYSEKPPKFGVGCELYVFVLQKLFVNLTQ